MKRITTVVMTFAAMTAASNALWAQGHDGPSNCSGLPSASDLKTFLVAAPSTGGDAGGLFHGTRMWVAVVNRDGKLCAVANSQSDPSQVWPGSQSIAKAKAYTATHSAWIHWPFPGAPVHVHATWPLPLESGPGESV